jgi:hypothetical protein
MATLLFGGYMKKLVLLSSVLLFGLAPVAHAEFSFRSIKEKVSSSAHTLVKNAWSIAGGMCLLGSIGSGAAIAYQNTLSSHPALETAKALVVPAAFGIGSLLCFNFAERIAQQEALETVKNDTIKNNLALLQAKVASQKVVNNFENRKKDAERHLYINALSNLDSHLQSLSNKIDQTNQESLREKIDDISMIKDTLAEINDVLVGLQAEIVSQKVAYQESSDAFLERLLSNLTPKTTPQRNFTRSGIYPKANVFDK